MSLKRLSASVLMLALRGTALILCGVAVAALVIAYGEHQDHPWMPSGRSLSLVLLTVVVFAIVIGEFRACWRRVSFWLTIVVILGLHIAACRLAVSAFSEWRAIYLTPIVYLEIVGLHWVLYALGYSPYRARRVREARSVSRGRNT
jgi:hypothetical protein